jgi:hypothetical protein
LVAVLNRCVRWATVDLRESSSRFCWSLNGTGNG